METTDDGADMRRNDELLPVSSAAIAAGGVELRLEGPGVTGVEAYALWQKVYDTVSNARNRVGSGSGFSAERAEQERSPWIGEGGPKARTEVHISPAGKKPGCFHTWPGCNC